MSPTPGHSSADRGTARDTSTLLRSGILALAGIGIAGTVVELVFLRHWNTATATIVWVGIAALAAGFAALLGRPTAGRVRAVRVLSTVGLVIGIIGIGFHVAANLDAGPLDRVFAARWATMSAIDQWWAAGTGGVGPAPTLAPGTLAEISLALLLATVRHPGVSVPPRP